MKRINLNIERVAMRIPKWVGSVSSLLIHTALFLSAFLVHYISGVPLGEVMLVTTTIVSLEAIYLSIFIQMSVNTQGSKLQLVALDVEDIQEDVEEIQENVEEIQENVEEIQENVEEIQKDVEEIQEDEDEDENEDALLRIERILAVLIKEVSDLKKHQKKN